MGAQAPRFSRSLLIPNSYHNGCHEGYEGHEGDEGDEGHEGDEGDEESGGAGGPQGHEEEVKSFSSSGRTSIDVTSSFRTSAAETSRVATLQLSLPGVEMYLQRAVAKK